MKLVSETPVGPVDAVPIIDISGYFTGSASEKQRIAREIGKACRTIGFLVVTDMVCPMN